MNRNIETRKLRFETEQDKEIFLQVMSKSNWGAEYEGVEEIYPYDVRFNLETSRPSKKSEVNVQFETLYDIEGNEVRAVRKDNLPEPVRFSKKSLLERQTEATEKIASIAAGPGIKFNIENGQLVTHLDIEDNEHYIQMHEDRLAELEKKVDRFDELESMVIENRVIGARSVEHYTKEEVDKMFRNNISVYSVDNINKELDVRLDGEVYTLKLK